MSYVLSKWCMQEEMVSSLCWLTHSPEQAVDLVEQTNAVIRRLLTTGQLELAAKAAQQVPKDTIAR
jgi:hypothetical protein